MVRTGGGDGCGDFESHTGGCSSPVTPGLGKDGGAALSSSASAGAPRGRFWACSGEDDGEGSSEEERPDLAGGAQREIEGTEGASSRRPREAVSWGGFIERAEELGGSLRHRRRTAFAPGRKTSRFRAGSAPRFTRLGDGYARRGGRERGGGRRGARGMGTAGGGTAGSGRPPPSPVSPRSEVSPGSSGEEGNLPTRTGARPTRTRAGPVVGLTEVETGHPLLLLGPPLGELDGPQGDPVRPVSQEVAQYDGPRWLWLAKGCTTPSLGFPARSSEVSRFHTTARTLFRIPAPPPLTRSFAEVVMERYGGEGSGGDGRNKRRYGGYGDGDSRRQGSGRQEGGRQELGRHDGGRSELGRREEGRQDGGRSGRFDEEPRPCYGEPCATDQGRGDWGPPPPWWDWEQERLREEEATRDRGQLQASAGGRGGRGGGGGGQAGRNKKGSGQGAPPNPKNKGKNKPMAGGAAGAVGGECFRCGREGHFQSDCPNEPVCVLCSREGQASANCPTRGRPMMLQQMGHAITGGGFYNIEVEPLEGSGQNETFEAVIHVKVAPLSALQLADELKNLLDGSWDWRVAKVSEKEFSVRFPSRETLRMSTRRGKIYLPLSKLDVDIREAFVNPRPGKAMPPVWVQLTGLPGDLMERERLMAALTMVGRPLDVDELSVKKWKTEPVRVRFQCRFPERIKGTIVLCVNGEPYTVGVQAELGAPGAGGLQPS
ncbi:hypothetical protein QYE76_037981 [Lolium multiflorum]|uniref:CCHC-type domain-containing protein n=1 Tax=Lolium multiflorum TaxID=4521 RepID=A0AAD8WT75_LOLMU|nr:hypothetical protein QYE76_037981 [Lolium multiflorum]